MAIFNEIALEEGRQPLGEQNTQSLREGAANDPVLGIRAKKRKRQPMVTKVNRRDRLSMAEVICKAPKKARRADRWELAKDCIMGDQWMVELGSGDMESKWEYLAEGELPTPISVVKCPSKLMLNAWVGWKQKSKLVWCNRYRTLAGEATWTKRFFKALEDDTEEGECEDPEHGEGEACMECASCVEARKKAGHSFEEVLESLKPLMVKNNRRVKGASENKPDVKMWMDAAPCGWTRECIEYLEKECKAERAERDDMAQGRGQVLYSPTHKIKKSAGSAADMTWMDSGVIRHFKLQLRKRLAKVDGGRRQVLVKDEMWELCQEVWDAIPIEDLRPYMLHTELRCKIIRDKKGEWVGWSKDGIARHGQSL